MDYNITILGLIINQWILGTPTTMENFVVGKRFPMYLQCMEINLMVNLNI